MLTILNDVHLSAERSAGTTPTTRAALKVRTTAKFGELLPVRGDLMILGDLFDSYSASNSDLLAAYDLLCDWMYATPKTLYLVPGNHDVARSSNVMGSFFLLAHLLKGRYPDNVELLDKPQMTPYGYVIPHLPNQELFNLAVERVPECDFLFVHCNIGNNFAAQSDQSLNLEWEQIAACKAKHIVCAHEHHGRQLGKVTIPGNQIATSVADWLSPGDKQFAVIDDGKLNLHTCARRADEFVEMPWHDLADTDVPFVRVGGNATAAQASEALAAVAAYRRRSPALVVTNAVKVESAEGGSFESAVQDMVGFDVMGMLRGVLTADEIKILESLK